MQAPPVRSTAPASEQRLIAYQDAERDARDVVRRWLIRIHLFACATHLDFEFQPL
jgi:hypothetical protein